FSQQALDRLTIAVDGGAYKSVQPVPHVGHRRQQPRCYALSDLKFPADFACAARGAEVTVPGNDLTLNGEWEQQGSVVTFSHLPEIGGKGVCRGESGRFGDHCPDEKRRPGRRGEPRRRTGVPSSQQLQECEVFTFRLGRDRKSTRLNSSHV